MRRLALLSLIFVSAPAFAAHFEARPVAPPAAERFVARENLWSCSAAGCASSRTATRPAIVCSALAREVGRLASFSVAGVAFTAEQLEACNSRAR